MSASALALPTPSSFVDVDPFSSAGAGPSRIAQHEAPSVFDTLSTSLPFDADQAFWWNTSGKILSRMFSLLRYDAHIQYLHMLFFHQRVARYMGSRPKGKEPSFKSYMVRALVYLPKNKCLRSRRPMITHLSK